MYLPFSNRQFPDFNGRPHLGAQLFVYQAETTTPADVFASPDLDPAKKLQWPIPVDGSGYLPAVYVGQGTFDVLVTDGASLSPPGAVLLSAAGIPGDPAPATTPAFDPLRQIPPGAYGFFAASGGMNGWVPANGGTIGNAGSGASTRANADCLALFTVLWEGRSELAVSPGRGGSAAGDFAAGATIRLPDLNSRLLAFVAPGSPTGNLLAAGLQDPASPKNVLLGSFGGEATHTLIEAELAAHAHEATFAGDAVPDHDHVITIATDSPDHSHNQTVKGFKIISATSGQIVASFYAFPDADAGITTQTGGAQGKHGHPGSSSANAGGHTPSGSVTIASDGASAAHNCLPPFAVAGGVYLKL